MSMERIAIQVCKAMSAKLLQRLINITSRATIKLVDMNKKVQIVQVDGYADETLSDVEMFQNWGFRSVPKAGAECIILSMGGSRDNTIVIASEDRNTPPPTMKAGESGIYTGKNHFIMLREDGRVEIKNEQFEYMQVDNEWKNEVITARTFTLAGPQLLIGQNKTFPVILKKQETFVVES